MKDQILIDIAEGFRNGICGKRSSVGMCRMVCLPLQGYLHALHSIDAKCVEGENGVGEHMWLELPDGRVLDPTIDQYNVMFPHMNLPKVWLDKPHPKIHIT